MEEAVVHRKRSSRIAIKETEKEQAREAAKKKAEEEEKQSRAKRMEARAKKEEAERQKRDKERERRRLEREEREERARQKEERAKRRYAIARVLLAVRELTLSTEQRRRKNDAHRPARLQQARIRPNRFFSAVCRRPRVSKRLDGCSTARFVVSVEPIL